MANEPVEIEINVGCDGEIGFILYRDDGCICATSGVLSDGTAYGHILDGTNVIARARLSPDEIASEREIAESERWADQQAE